MARHSRGLQDSAAFHRGHENVRAILIAWPARVACNDEVFVDF
jgi:hypothetical protein